MCGDFGFLPNSKTSSICLLSTWLAVELMAMGRGGGRKQLREPDSHDLEQWPRASVVPGTYQKEAARTGDRDQTGEGF